LLDFGGAAVSGHRGESTRRVAPTSSRPQAWFGDAITPKFGLEKVPSEDLGCIWVPKCNLGTRAKKPGLYPPFLKGG
jgi:hypothetical protein